MRDNYYVTNKSHAPLHKSEEADQRHSKDPSAQFTYRNAVPDWDEHPYLGPYAREKRLSGPLLAPKVDCSVPSVFKYSQPTERGRIFQQYYNGPCNCRI